MVFLIFIIWQTYKFVTYTTRYITFQKKEKNNSNYVILVVLLINYLIIFKAPNDSSLKDELKNSSITFIK